MSGAAYVLLGGAVIVAALMVAAKLLGPQLPPRDKEEGDR